MSDIVVVDDDAYMWVLMPALLKHIDQTAQCAASGEEALELIGSTTFRLMITDFNMPGMNGIDLARRAREIAPAMPIILFTAESSPHIRPLAKEAGISLVLNKPLVNHALLKAVKDLISLPCPGNERRPNPSLH